MGRRTRALDDDDELESPVKKALKVTEPGKSLFSIILCRLIYVIQMIQIQDQSVRPVVKEESLHGSQPFQTKSDLTFAQMLRCNPGPGGFHSRRL
jgi:hypothetical protein